MAKKIKISELPEARDLQGFFTVGTKYESDDEKQENPKSVKMSLQFLEDNENERIKNENERKTNEENRQRQETTRQTNEQNRITAENNRVTAENKRVEAENERIEAEKKRTTAEESRVSNENTRQINENARIEAEKSRVAAETKREQDFSNALNEFNTNSKKAIDDFNIKGTEALNKVASDTSSALADFKNERESALSDFSTERQQALNNFKNERELALEEFEIKTNQALTKFSNDSENALQEVKDATETLSALNNNPPIIRNGTWWLYSLENQDYVNTGVVAESHSPYIDENTLEWKVWDDTEQMYKDSGVSAYPFNIPSDNYVAELMKEWDNEETLAETNELKEA